MMMMMESTGRFAVEMYKWHVHVTFQIFVREGTRFFGSRIWWLTCRHSWQVEDLWYVQYLETWNIIETWIKLPFHIEQSHSNTQYFDTTFKGEVGAAAVLPATVGCGTSATLLAGAMCRGEIWVPPRGMCVDILYMFVYLFTCMFIYYIDMIYIEFAHVQSFSMVGEVNFYQFLIYYTACCAFWWTFPLGWWETHNQPLTVTAWRYHSNQWRWTNECSGGKFEAQGCFSHKLDITEEPLTLKWKGTGRNRKTLRFMTLIIDDHMFSIYIYIYVIVILAFFGNRWLYLLGFKAAQLPKNV